MLCVGKSGQTFINMSSGHSYGASLSGFLYQGTTKVAQCVPNRVAWRG